ncbi:MAG: FG-GAP-like repeat-containing protein [Acidobacteriota bacterium]
MMFIRYFNVGARRAACSMLGAVASAAGFGLLAVAPPSAAQAPPPAFLEPDVELVRSLDGTQVGDYFGWVVADADDLDGDGVRDVVVPAIAFDGFSGRIAAFSGADGAKLFEVIGVPGAAFGYSVTRAGDVDGDGVPDVIAGGGQTLVLSGADGAVLLDLGAVVGFADAVAGAGDLDGDGLDDLVVGSAGASVSGPGAGRIVAFSGADGSVLWTRDGAAEGDALGSALGRLDDLDRDGVPEVVAGAQGAGPTDGGEALVLSGVDGSLVRTLRPRRPEDASVFGSFFASGTPDLDRDGVGDIYIGDLDAATEKGPSTGIAHVFSGRTGRLLHELRGLSAGEGFGLGRGVEDLNGDGFADLVIGAFNNSAGAPSAGAVYVFSGRSGALLRTVTSTVVGENFGGDATATDDLDGDGLPELVATAPGLSFVGIAPGRTLLVAGTRLPCPSDLTGDGRVGLLDLLQLKRWRGATGGPADLDGSGLVDVRDLIVLVRDLGRCAPGAPR